MKKIKEMQCTVIIPEATKKIDFNQKMLPK